MGLRFRQRLGQYRIEGKLASGGFAVVHKAFDTALGIRVAIKIPHDYMVDAETRDRFRQEVRLAARLDHPNILPIKTAGVIDGQFVLVTPLGIESLADRMTRRMGRKLVIEVARQLLEALACAHKERVIHCDVKPENLIVFPGNLVRLADFGLARIALRSINASGSGTVGYLAPEQALGRPSLRSDVFSAGMILYRLMSGKLPEWPFRAPLPGMARAQSQYHPDLVALVLRAIEVDETKRFRDAGAMLAAFKKLENRALKTPSQKKKRNTSRSAARDWKAERRKQFQREFGRELRATHECTSCSGPVSEEMSFCPWCKQRLSLDPESTRHPAFCQGCGHGAKLDWRFCGWCHGGAIGPLSTREYSDSHYEWRCKNKKCTHRLLLPFMKYCPWCRAKVTHKWRIEGSRDSCKGCGWGVLRDYWESCPWCGKRIVK